MDEGGLSSLSGVLVSQYWGGYEGERALLYKANLMIVIYKTRIKVECSNKCQHTVNTSTVGDCPIKICYNTYTVHCKSRIKTSHVQYTHCVHIHEILCTFLKLLYWLLLPVTTLLLHVVLSLLCLGFCLVYTVLHVHTDSVYCTGCTTLY